MNGCIRGFEDSLRNWLLHPSKASATPCFKSYRYEETWSSGLGQEGCTRLYSLFLDVTYTVDDYTKHTASFTKVYIYVLFCKHLSV
ncbi:uncharacterized protein DS421_13g403120 [Arachis hypogaea]|nr:uncharacterized protein DS421_13g403120 [Arachis hypogaea]